MKFHNCEYNKANVIDLNGDCIMSLQEDTLVSPVEGYFEVVG